MKLLLCVLIGAALAYAQNPETSSWPPTAATDTDLLVLSNTAQDTLNGGIDSSTLTIVLNSAAEFTTPLIVRIDNEYVKICSKSTNTFTACSGGRGFLGSTAASHSSGATVSGYYVSYYHNKLAAEIKALEGSAVHAGSTFGTDNSILVADGTGRGSKASLCTIVAGAISCPGTAGGSEVLGNPTGDTAASFFEANSGDAASNGEPAYIKLWSSHSTKRQASLFPCTDADGFMCIASTTPSADATAVIVTAAKDSTVGRTLRVTGTNTYAFGALDLADTDAVTGLLPDGNIAAAIARDSEVAATYAPLVSPSFTTPTLGAASATSIAFGADPADAQPIRLSNNTGLAWEAATPGTDLTFLLNSSDEFVASAHVNVPSEVYDASGWNGDTTVPQKDAIRDVIVTLAPLDSPVFTTVATLPNGAAPTVDAVGEIAFDTNVLASGRGAFLSYDGTALTVMIGVSAADTPVNGQTLKINNGVITWEDDNGGGTGCVPSGSNNQIITDDGAGACVSEAQWTIASSVLAAGASGVFDASAASVTAGFKLPAGAGAAPTGENFIAFDTTADTIAFGNGSSTDRAVKVNGSAPSAGFAKFAGSTYAATSASIVAGDLPANNRLSTIGITIDGGGSAITTGAKGYVTVPFACTITTWSVVADQTGSIVVDVWKDTTLPTVADTITASAKPTLSSASLNANQAPTGWTTSVSAYDVLGFNVDSATTVTKATVTIACQR